LNYFSRERREETRQKERNEQDRINMFRNERRLISLFLLLSQYSMTFFQRKKGELSTNEKREEEDSS